MFNTLVKFLYSTEKILIESIIAGDPINFEVPKLEHTYCEYNYGRNRIGVINPYVTTYCTTLNQPKKRQHTILKYYNICVNGTIFFKCIEEAELEYFKVGSEIDAKCIFGYWWSIDKKILTFRVLGLGVIGTCVLLCLPGIL